MPTALEQLQALLSGVPPYADVQMKGTPPFVPGPKGKPAKKTGSATTQRVDTGNPSTATADGDVIEQMNKGSKLDRIKLALKSPQFQQFALSAGQALSSPPQWGQSTLGHYVNSLGQGLNGVAMMAELQRQRAEAQRKAQLETIKAQADVMKTGSEIDEARARTGDIPEKRKTENTQAQTEAGKAAETARSNGAQELHNGAVLAETIRNNQADVKLKQDQIAANTASDTGKNKSAETIASENRKNQYGIALLNAHTALQISATAGGKTAQEAKLYMDAANQALSEQKANSTMVDMAVIMAAGEADPNAALVKMQKDVEGRLKQRTEELFNEALKKQGTGKPAGSVAATPSSVAPVAGPLKPRADGTYDYVPSK